MLNELGMTVQKKSGTVCRHARGWRHATTYTCINAITVECYWLTWQRLLQLYTLTCLPWCLLARDRWEEITLPEHAPGENLSDTNQTYCTEWNTASREVQQSKGFRNETAIFLVARSLPCGTTSVVSINITLYLFEVSVQRHQYFPWTRPLPPLRRAANERGYDGGLR